MSSVIASVTKAGSVEIKGSSPGVGFGVGGGGVGGVSGNTKSGVLTQPTIAMTANRAIRIV